MILATYIIQTYCALENWQRAGYQSCTFRALQVAETRKSEDFREKNRKKILLLFDRKLQYDN